MALDINKVATAAAESYLRSHHSQSPNGKVEAKKHGRLGGVGAIALGVGVAVAARAVYTRARRFDLATAAGKVEEKLGG